MNQNYKTSANPPDESNEIIQIEGNCPETITSCEFKDIFNLFNESCVQFANTLPNDQRNEIIKTQRKIFECLTIDSLIRAIASFMLALNEISIKFLEFCALRYTHFFMPILTVSSIKY